MITIRTMNIEDMEVTLLRANIDNAKELHAMQV